MVTEVWFVIGTLSPALPPGRAYRVHREEYEPVYPRPVLAAAALPRQRPLGAGYAGAPLPPSWGPGTPPIRGEEIQHLLIVPTAPATGDTAWLHPHQSSSNVTTFRRPPTHR